MEPTLIADERTQLEEFLETNRDELVEALDGLDEEQVRRRLVPSLTTLLGLVKHVTWAEQVWFHVGLAGRTREELGIPHENDPSWELDDDDTIARCSPSTGACAPRPATSPRPTPSTTWSGTTAAAR